MSNKKHTFRLSKNLKRSLKVSLAILGVFLFSLLTLSAFAYVYFLDRIYPNIYIGNINMVGKTQQEAAALIIPKINLPQSITLLYQDKTFILPVDSLEIKFDQDKTTKKALNTGRSGIISQDFADLLGLVTTRKDLPLELTVNESVLTTSLTHIAEEIDIQPKNAEFTVQNSKIITFSLEQQGLKVNLTGLATSLSHAINENTGKAILIPIPTEVVPPDITASDINNLGLKELIGTGTSHFTGSIASRIYNINLSASRINNTLIPPNETFSFNATVGDISALNGYQQAYIIQNGQTVLGDGGGVCQVSTTLFRTALNSGLPIVERHAHAYRVRYYEQDSAPGFDATIYTPSIDFKFKNDTANYILIQTQIDLKNLILTFNLYGTKDGRTVNITQPVLWDYKPAPQNLYIDDPTLPVGQTKQIDFAATGIKSRFNYTVTKDSQLLTNQTFYSDFKPWQAKFLRGTKIN